MLPSHLNLTNHRRYINRFIDRYRPAAFEYLAASAFSKIFYLPFQSNDTEDASITHRVIWHGRINRRLRTFSKSPSGPDATCFCYGFYNLIETTLKVGTGQWRKEFIESLRHYDDFVTNNNVDKKDVYLTFIVPKLHKDTYTGFQPKVNESYNIILLESSWLAKIVDTSKMISTIRHLDLRYLFMNIIKIFQESTAFENFKADANKAISESQKDVITREKTVFFGLRSYEAMKKVGRNTVGTSEILLNLHKDAKFKRYTKILGNIDLTSHIKEGLIFERLAYLIPSPDENFFHKVNSPDFKARGLRLIKTVEEING